MTKLDSIDFSDIKDDKQYMVVTAAIGDSENLYRDASGKDVKDYIKEKQTFCDWLQIGPEAELLTEIQDAQVDYYHEGYPFISVFESI